MGPSDRAELDLGPAPGQSLNRIIVVTRFGLGQRSSRYYEQALPLLVNFLAPSIASQTDQDFVWVLLCDSECPPLVRAQLARLNGLVPQLLVHFHDPFVGMRLVPDLQTLLPELVGLQPNLFTVTLRVDSDDAISVEYIEVLRRDVCRVLDLHGGADSGFIAPKGAVLYMRGGKSFGLVKRNYSVVAVGSRYAPTFVHCFSYPHTVAGTSASGLLVRELSGSGPLWLRVIAHSAEHRSGSKNRVSHLGDFFPVVRRLARKLRPGSLAHSELITERIWPELLDRTFGLTLSKTSFLKQVQSTRSLQIPKAIRAAHGRKRKRMELKRVILDAAVEDFPSGGTDSDHDAWLKRWKQDFYSF